MIDNDRSQWTVSTQSYSYRLYQWWFRMSRKGPLSHSPPRPIDLCHYMRVILIWVWLRWFFTSRLLPWLWTGSVAFLGINAWFWSMWPEQMKTVFIIYGCLVVLLILACLIYEFTDQGRWSAAGDRFEAYLQRKWKQAEPHLERFVENVLSPFCWWFFMRPFYWRIYPWMVAVVAVFATLTIFFPGNMLEMLIVVASAVGVLLVVVGLVVAFVFAEETYQVHREAKKAMASDEDAEAEPDVSQKHEFLRLIWQYIVSRKHRICPFIVPTEGPTATATSKGKS